MRAVLPASSKLLYLRCACPQSCCCGSAAPRLAGGYAFIAPLESNIAVNDYLQPWKACFGPNEQVDMKLLQSGKKLPCFYKQNKCGNYDYW
jgi:hypothetical protein